MSQSSQTNDACPRSRDDWLRSGPKLLRQIETAEDTEQQLEAMQLVCESFVPAVSVEEVEKVVLSQLMPKVHCCYDTHLNSLLSLMNCTEAALDTVINQIQHHLSNCARITCCLTTAVGNLLQSGEKLLLGHYFSVPPAALHIVQTSYEHCKESARIYGDALTAVSDQLSELFRTVAALQEAFIKLVDNTSVPTSASDEDLEQLCQIVLGVFDIGRVASLLDRRTSLVCWKAASKWCSLHRDLLYNRLDVTSIVKALTQDVVDSVRDLLIQADDDASFSKRVRIVGLVLRFLVKICKEYENCLGNSIASVVDLILEILSISPASLQPGSVSEKRRADIQQHVVTAVEPLVQSLLLNHDFMLEVTKSETSISGEKNGLPSLMLNLQILGLLPQLADDVQEKWIRPKLNPEDEARDSILKVLFRSFYNAHTSLRLPATDPFLLPGTMHGGKPQRMVTVYEYTCTNVCSFVAALPSSMFSALEDVLVENILSTNLQSAVLGIDVLSFVSRYGTADLCRDHCFMAADLLVSSQLTSLPQCSHLVLLLRRLWSFMATEHQIDFVEKYSPSENISLWSVVCLSKLPVSMAGEVAESLLETCVDCLKKWTEKASPTADDTHIVIPSLNCLTNVFNNDSNSAVAGVLASHRARVVKEVLSLWSALPLHVVPKCDLLQMVVSSLTKLTTCVILTLEGPQVWTVISALSHVLHLKPKPKVKLAVLDMLRVLGGKTLPPSFEQTQILRTIPVMFSSLLQDPCCVVRRYALQAFAQFAEQTTHESVMQESLASSDTLREEVVQYFREVAEGVCIEPSVEQILALDETLKTMGMAHVVDDLSQPGDQEDAHAHSTAALHDDDLLKATLEQLHICVGVLHEKNSATGLPDWVKEELHTVHARLKPLCS